MCTLEFRSCGKVFRSTYVISEAEVVYRKTGVGLGVFCQWYMDVFHSALEMKLGGR